MYLCEKLRTDWRFLIGRMIHATMHMKGILLLSTSFMEILWPQVFREASILICLKTKIQYRIWNDPEDEPCGLHRKCWRPLWALLRIQLHILCRTFLLVYLQNCKKDWTRKKRNPILILTEPQGCKVKESFEQFYFEECILISGQNKFDD